MSIFFKKLFAVGSIFVLSSMLIGGLININIFQKLASASVIESCSTSEILENGNCIFTKVTNSQYETKCASDYTLMDGVCTKFITQSCSYFSQAIEAESGFCKLNLSNSSNTVFANEIVDNDGRQCNGVGTNFKRYNVNLSLTGSTLGPVICGNNFSALDKTTFRFLPRIIIEITNLSSIQTQVTYPPCPSNYSELLPNKCSRPAIVQGCSAGGEIFDNNVCLPCPAGQYCPTDGTITKILTVCTSGGNLISNLCVAPNKYSTVTYIDGCTSEYVKKDQSCAIVENRTHDTGCSYFYSSENINVTASQGPDGYCSTGGRIDFSSASIVRVSDFNCNGVGTYYYNYNVAFDPLVCGNDYSIVGRSGFKWLPLTFTRITNLQKIPVTSLVCPTGWVSFDSSNNCSQPPITQEYKKAIDCPINTYCPGSTTTPIACPAGTTSPVRSIKLSDCTVIKCTNGATNAPSCNQCLSGMQLINNQCLPICPNGINRDNSNNCTICVNGAANPSSGCNACPASYQFSGYICVQIPNIICKNGFDLVNSSCVCISPKVIIDKPINNSGLYETVCQNQASSSSVTISGYVYVDSNNNGNFESNESPLAGVTITLLGIQYPCKNSNIYTTTNANGFYQFSNQLPCNYTVIETQPSGYNNGVTTAGTVNGVRVGNVSISDKIENIVLTEGQNSINNNFGEVLINSPVSTNGGATIINNNNNPVTNNNNSVSNNNVVNNYPAPVAQQAPKPQFIPMTAPVAPTIYYSSPVANVTETIRSGGFNVILIISTLVAVASFGLIYIRGKPNRRFQNYAFSNCIDK